MALLAAENKYLIHSASWILLHSLPPSNKLAVHFATLSLFLNQLHLPWLRTLAHLCILASWFCFDLLIDSPIVTCPSPHPWFRLAHGCILLTTSAICLFNKLEDQSNNCIRSSQTTPPSHAVGQLTHPPGEVWGLVLWREHFWAGRHPGIAERQGNVGWPLTVSFGVWGK